eukprot:NODE_9_length_64580_cov_1.431941.p26 type:complete len:320 gc:universal NODE_9_length_64580_cov_1.431941:28897-29856(+)
MKERLKNGLRRRVFAASKGIKNLLLSDASINSSMCQQQCHHFFTLILSNMDQLLPQKYFQSLESIAYCLSLDKIPARHGYTPFICEIVIEIISLPITCRLFEVADLLRKRGFIGEFWIVLNAIAARVLNNYEYEVAKFYTKQWKMNGKIYEFQYQNQSLPSIMNDMFKQDDVSKVLYLMKSIKTFHFYSYCENLGNIIHELCDFEICQFMEEIEDLIDNRLLNVKIDPFAVLYLIFCCFKHKVDWSSQLLQNVYGYIKAVEIEYGYGKVVDFLSKFKPGISQSLQFFFETSLNSKFDKNVQYFNHPHFLILMKENPSDI